MCCYFARYAKRKGVLSCTYVYTVYAVTYNNNSDSQV